MKETLILYEGKYGHSRKTAEILHEMLESSECLPAEKAPETLAGVKNLILVFGFLAYDTAQILKPYLEGHQKELEKLTIGVIGVGLAKQALPAFLKIIEEPMGRKADGSWFVMGGYRVAELTETDRKLLEDFWGRKGVPLTDKLYFKEDAVRKTGEELQVMLSNCKVKSVLN